MNNYRIFCDLDGVFHVQRRTPEGWQTIKTTGKGEQGFEKAESFIDDATP